MSVIDYTYFTGKLNLPQTGNSEGRVLINQFIEIYETEYLKKVLGYDLWKAFSTGIEGSGTPDQRWLDLLEGKDFSYSSRNYSWTGLDPESKITPIANYVYYRYMEEKASDNTLVGTATGAVDNNTRTAPLSKMIDAWNSMVEMDKTLWYFLTANKDTYPEWTYWSSSWDWWWSSRTCQRNEVFHFKNSLDL